MKNKAAETRKALGDYRYWHQERRDRSFAAGEDERTGRLGRAAQERELAAEAEVKMNEAKARFTELTGVEPLLF